MKLWHTAGLLPAGKQKEHLSRRHGQGDRDRRGRLLAVHRGPRSGCGGPAINQRAQAHTPSAVDGGTAGDGGAVPDTTLTVRKTLDTSESGGEAFQSVALFSGVPVDVVGAGTERVFTNERGAYRAQVSSGSMGISCATLGGVGMRAIERVDAFGVTHFEPIMTEVPACSVSYQVGSW